MGSWWVTIEGDGRGGGSFAHEGCEPASCYLDRHWVRHYMQSAERNLGSCNIYIFYANAYKHFDQYGQINWSMRKYLGRLDLEIRNIWTTNECIDRVNLGYTTFYKNRACRRDLHRIQEININKVYIFRWLVITTLVAKKKYSSKFYDDLIVLINLWRYPNIIMVDGLGIYLEN